MRKQASLRVLAMAVAACASPSTLMAVEDQGFAEVIPVIVAPAVPAPAAAAPAQPSALVLAIQQASTPSVAIQAYADARAANPNDLAAEQAYVRRMADLGLPEMADAQARDLTKRTPDNGMGWAVSAYVAAKRDQVDEAVTDISTAVRLLPDDPFTQRTAGQIVAWYDTTADRLSSPAAIRAAVDSLRSSMQTKPTFSSAYLEASNVYRAATTGATTQPSAPQEANVVPPVYVAPSAPVYQTPTYYDGYYNDGVYGYYGGGYYGGGYYGGPYWWPSTWWPGCGWWWPTWGSVVIVNGNFHGHDHDNFHHHGFDGHFGNHVDGHFGNHSAGHFDSHQAPFAPHGGFHGGFAGTGSPANFSHGGFTEHLPAGFVPAGHGATFSGGGGAMRSAPVVHGSAPTMGAMPAAGHLSGSMGHGSGGAPPMGGGGFHDGGGSGGGMGGGMHGGGGGMGGGGHR